MGLGCVEECIVIRITGGAVVELEDAGCSPLYAPSSVHRSIETVKACLDCIAQYGRALELG